MPDGDALCACGDVYEEHDDGRECGVMNCGCIHFEGTEDDYEED